MDAFDRIAARTPKETKRFVSKMLDVADRIHEILEVKGMTQKDLARALGKSESEISKWLTGKHNLELKTIARIEEVLGEDILAVPTVPKKQFTAVGASQRRYYGGPYMLKVEPSIEEVGWPEMTKYLVDHFTVQEPKLNNIVLYRLDSKHTFGMGIVSESRVKILQKRMKELLDQMRQQSDNLPSDNLTLFEINQ